MDFGRSSHPSGSVLGRAEGIHRESNRLGQSFIGGKGEKSKANGGDLGFEAKLWQAADKMRGNLDAAEYKHVALGLIFLKYISDAFEARLQQAKDDPEECSLLDDPDAARDIFLGDGIFFLPERAQWTFLKENATSTQPTIGQLIDEA